MLMGISRRGSRFNYTHYFTSLPSPENPLESGKSQALTNRTRVTSPEIWESIEALDRQGMKCVESGEHEVFSSYLKRTRNTICGRHPIGVMMAAFENQELLPGKGKFRFIRYEQSSKVRQASDSSVGYASAFAMV